MKILTMLLWGMGCVSFLRNKNKILPDLCILYICWQVIIVFLTYNWLQQWLHYFDLKEIARISNMYIAYQYSSTLHTTSRYHIECEDEAVGRS